MEQKKADEKVLTSSRSNDQEGIRDILFFVLEIFNDFRKKVESVYCKNIKTACFACLGEILPISPHTETPASLCISCREAISQDGWKDLYRRTIR